MNNQGLEEYPKITIVLENALLIIWVILGSIACWYISPIITLVYISFAIIMLIFVLRKTLCTKCYYYNKWCHVGWGKLAALFFKKGDPNKFNSKSIQILPPITYGLLAIVPLILIIISIFQEYIITKLLLLIFFAITAFLSSVTIRKKSCTLCKMKGGCQGCAVK